MQLQERVHVLWAVWVAPNVLRWRRASHGRRHWGKDRRPDNGKSHSRPCPQAPSPTPMPMPMPLFQCRCRCRCGRCGCLCGRLCRRLLAAACANPAASDGTSREGEGDAPRQVPTAQEPQPTVGSLAATRTEELIYGMGMGACMGMGRGVGLDGFACEDGAGWTRPTSFGGGGQHARFPSAQ